MIIVLGFIWGASNHVYFFLMLKNKVSGQREANVCHRVRLSQQTHTAMVYERLFPLWLSCSTLQKMELPLPPSSSLVLLSLPLSTFLVYTQQQGLRKERLRTVKGRWGRWVGKWINKDALLPLPSSLLYTPYSCTQKNMSWGRNIHGLLRVGEVGKHSLQPPLPPSPPLYTFLLNNKSVSARNIQWWLRKSEENI